MMRLREGRILVVYICRVHEGFIIQTNSLISLPLVEYESYQYP